MNSFTKSSSQHPISILKTGGSSASSLVQRIRELMDWKTIGIAVFVLLVIILLYYLYRQFSSTKTGFTANREGAGSATAAESNKTATLMFFYTDWCPHCKTAKPEWEGIKAEYDGKSINGYTMNFVEYNCTNESEEITKLMEKYSIEGYPTIKLAKDNQVIEYDAKPTKATMSEFLNTVL